MSRPFINRISHTLSDQEDVEGYTIFNYMKPKEIFTRVRQEKKYISSLSNFLVMDYVHCITNELI